jgi:hypothetical protein
MDNHEGPARGYQMETRGYPPRRGVITENLNDWAARHGPVRIIVPDDKPEKHFVAYFVPGSRREMVRASYHSYTEALRNPDHRVEDEFERRYLDIFCK